MLTHFRGIEDNGLTTSGDARQVPGGERNSVQRRIPSARHLTDVETKHQKTPLEAEERLVKDDASDYITGVAHTTSGRFVANDITADVYVSYRPQRDYDTEGFQKIKDLEEQLRVAKKTGIIIHQTPFLVVRIVPA
ncbi:MAG: hypothetical protein M1395_00420 [Bacteroidetes bacterium]|nr:hypothetical protein [Bacteroidota bacterium]